jgi:hypothetical protein
MYTLEDLEAAKAELSTWVDRFDRYTGNNPNKYHSDIGVARRNVSAIESSLKVNGTIPLSDAELLEKELDTAFPNAKSKQVVEYKGRTFQRRFWPIEKTRSGKNVSEWGESWTEIPRED